MAAVSAWATMSSRPGASFTFRTMGTLGYASWSPPGLDIGHLLAARADEIEHKLTRFRDDSEISRLASHSKPPPLPAPDPSSPSCTAPDSRDPSSGNWCSVSEDTATVLRAASRLQTETDGWFNPLLGDQVRAWEQLATGFLAAVPDACPADGRIEVHGNLARVAGGFSDSHPADEHGSRIDQAAQGKSVARGPARILNGGVAGGRRQKPMVAAMPRQASKSAEGGDAGGTSSRSTGFSIDLGAIAKGYAADQLRDLAVSLGATDVLISLGGSSMAIAGTPAKVGLASPWQGWENFGTLELTSGSLSVSADPGSRIRAGRQRSHLLDPAIGSPAVTDLAGVVVCGADGMACEAYSSAYLAMGLDAALLLDQAHPEFDTIFMTLDGRVLASPRLLLKASSGVQEWLKAQRKAAY